MTRPPAIGPILKKFLTGQNRPLTATQIGDQIGYPASDVRRALNALQILGEPVRYQPPPKNRWGGVLVIRGGCASSGSAPAAN